MWSSGAPIQRVPVVLGAEPQQLLPAVRKIEPVGPVTPALASFPQED